MGNVHPLGSGSFAAFAVFSAVMVMSNSGPMVCAAPGKRIASSTGAMR